MKKNYKHLKLIAVSALLLTTKLVAQSTYCTSNLGGSGCFGDNINNVTIIGTGLNNNSGCNSGPNGTYTYFAPGVGTTANLIVGFTYSMSINTTASNIESFWIDYNQNNAFDASEWVQPTTNSTPNVPTVVTFTIPLTAMTGTTGLRVRTRASFNTNNANSACSSFGSGECEDYIVTIIPATPCSTTPGANTVVAVSNLICPNSTANLSLSGNYTVVGISYLWQTSTVSAVGPYITIPTATTAYLSAPNVTVATWYSAIISCANTSGTITASASQVSVSATTTNNVPYSEGFESITSASQLPNCSWAVSSASTCITETNVTNTNGYANGGSKYARFQHYDPNTFNFFNATSEFYSSGIYLSAGVTYSANMYYMLDYSGNTNWSNLSMSVCPGQSPTGAVAIISQGPVVAPNYKAFGNSFSVLTSGIYYICVSATSDGGCCSGFISWDDLTVTAPCSLNTVSLNVTATNTVICAGQSVNITATGASNYSWSNGANTSAITVTPNGNTNYSVIGTNTTSGCSSTMSKLIIVNPTPAVSIFAQQNSVCKGSSLTLLAIGANGYSWSNNVSTAQNVVSPSVATTYSVSGTNSYGCVATSTILVNVNNLPQLTISSTGQQICVGETATLSAQGAGATGTYTWNSFNGIVPGASLFTNPPANASYTVYGTDSNGCVGSEVTSITVAACTGITQTNGIDALVTVFPNPTSGVFTLKFNSTELKLVEISDITGRVVYSTSTSLEALSVNFETLAAGLYSLKVIDDTNSSVVKIIKN